MSRAIPGFDYRIGRPVERTRKEWNEEVAKASRTDRADGDLLIFANVGGDHRLVAEIHERKESDR